MSRNLILTSTQKLVTEDCYRCGVMFAFPSELQDILIADHSRSFCCPNGHSQSYTGKTAEQKERERAEQLSQELARANTRALRQREARESAERRLSAAKGQQTKLKKRIANGTCPCCQRSFVNLHRHMSTQHPDFAPVADSSSERLG